MAVTAMQAAIINKSVKMKCALENVRAPTGNAEFL